MCVQYAILFSSFQVVHVSGVDLLRDHLSNCVSIDVLNCGHAIYMDEPEALARLIENFATRDASYY